jgi:hypothetical protein
MAPGSTSQDSPYPELSAVLAGEHGLTYREECILRQRFGLDITKRCYTYGDIGFFFGLSGERIRQLMRHALRNIGLADLHPPKAKGLAVDELHAHPLAAKLPLEPSTYRNYYSRGTFGSVARQLLTRHGDIEVTFIQHHKSGRVHIITPTDPDATPVAAAATPPGFADISATYHSAPVTLCGYYAHLHRGEFEAGDKLVHEFDDGLLCRPCVRELGPHSARAFEHPQPDPDDD